MTVTNRRSFHRITCPPTECFVEADGHRANCELHDESIGGFRISGIDPLMLKQNQAMRIEHRGEIVNVRCVNVSRTKSGGFSIGLQRNDSLNALVSHEYELDESFSDSSLAHGSLINPYVRFGKSVGVLCRVVAIESGDRVKIEVLGAKTFVVDTNQVSPLTANERRAELENLDCVEWLAELYSRSGSQPIEPTVDAILDSEFWQLPS